MMIISPPPTHNNIRRENMNYFKRNVEIRKAKGSIPNWFVAEKLGIHENSFYRLLRKELPEEKKKEILGVIEKIKSGQEEE